MSISSDTRQALSLLERIQHQLRASDSIQPVSQDLSKLISLLESPVFRNILTIQDSLHELRRQIHQHPSILPVDFDISNTGQLILNLPADSSTTFQQSFDSEQNYEFDRDTTTPIPNVDTNEQPVSRQVQASSGAFPPNYTPTTISTYPYTLEFQRAVEQATVGRDTHTIQLYKPEESSLGFSVVGLHSEDEGELGIFVQELQPSGIAARAPQIGSQAPSTAPQRNGRLQEGDQIVAIDGQPLDSNISHQQAISILQQAQGLVELIVARGRAEKKAGTVCKRDTRGSSSSSTVNDNDNENGKVADMVLNTEWAQVDVVDLINDGTGLGFGIVGGRSTGVVVKTILPGGVADRDGRLQSGDHILQICEVNLRGMGSEQVAAVLRQSGSHVRLIVARPIEPTSPDYQQTIQSHAPIVPTRLLNDPEELERHLTLLQAQNGFADPTLLPDGYNQHFVFDHLAPHGAGTTVQVHTAQHSSDSEIFDVELVKDQQGLGITIAGYVCEKDEISGIFVKSVTERSAAALDGRIEINDQIIEVDGISVEGFSNHQAVEVLRNTGQKVKLKLVRYLRGPKYEQLQLAIANSEMNIPPRNVVVVSSALPETLVEMTPPSVEEEEEEDEDLVEATNVDVEMNESIILVEDEFAGELDAQVEANICAKWQDVVGSEYMIVVAQLSKFRTGGGLGISLEGTVDVEDGLEVRPHHYIRSILADGPVGINGKLASGDELLEVNDIKLLGVNHIDVVAILKDLPRNVRLVCSRLIPSAMPPAEISSFYSVQTSPDVTNRSNSITIPSYGGSLQNLVPITDRLFKAKSDGSLAAPPSASDGSEAVFTKLKSRSLEPLTGLAMWSSEPQIIELNKGDRGLGFSILDYQDPMNSNETVIVIRSLVPGGVAQQDGRIIPGDRLVFVNNINLENATLDEAVQALKGAPKGVVLIGVTKPLPLPESANTSHQTRYDDDTTNHSLPPVIRNSPNLLQEQCADDDDVGSGSSDRVAKQLRDGATSQDSGASYLTRHLWQRQESETHPTIRPISRPQYRESVWDSPSGGGSERSTPLASPAPSPNLGRWTATVPPLPSALERTIKVKKATDQLGINVEAVDKGVNGVVIQSINAEGAIEKDARLQVGDYLVSINHESLRKISNSQARAILRRTQLLTSDISITYIPGPDAAVHRESALIMMREEALNNWQLSPNSPYISSEEEEEEEEESMTEGEGGADRNWSTPDALEMIVNSKTKYQRLDSTTTTDTSSSIPSSVKTPDSDSRTSPEPKISRIPSSSTSSSLSPAYISELVSVPDGSPSPPIEAGNASRTGAAAGAGITARAWGNERTVQVWREQGRSLGISIVGGKVDLCDSASGSTITGIFIKNVLPDSPAGRQGILKTGDRILEVDGVDLRNASHVRAVEIIRDAGNPIRFLVQSLVYWPKDANGDSASPPEEVPREPTSSPVDVNDELQCKVDQSVLQVPDIVQMTEESQLESKSEQMELGSESESDKEQVVTDLVFSKAAYIPANEEIHRASAASLKKSPNDPDTDDEFGYTQSKIVKKYGDLQGTVIIVDIQKGPNGLGLSLAGHKDRTKMSTFIVGLNPTGNAFKDGRIEVGDEILEVNGQVLYGRCHLNASAIIKSLTGNSIKFVLLRRPNALADLAVKPVTHFPVNVGDEPQATTENQLARFKEIRTVILKKGPTGFGVMIMEGKHNEAGQGIFISDIQEGSAAEQAGITVGDMILSVNDEDLLGANYETAASLLKKAEGTIRMVVSNPNKLMEPVPQAIKKDDKPAVPPKPTSFSTKSFLPHMQRLLKTPSPTNALNLAPSPTSIIGGLSPTTPTSAKTSPTTASMLQVTTVTVSSSSPTGASPSTTNVSPVTPLTPTMKPYKCRFGDDPASDPATCEIVAGLEATIEIAKEKMGLGLSIVGGSDTLLGAIIIHEVYPDGAAAKDGRLRPGDQILEVNNENLRDSTHDHAIGTLRQTPAKVKMVVFREENQAREEDIHETFEVELIKKPGKGLGLSIVGRKNGPGVFVSDVVKGGAAEADGRLIQGDQIISVNGHDLKNAMQEQAAAILKTSMGRIHMKVGRLKVVPHRTANGSTAKPNGTSDGVPLQCKTIALDRGVDGLGFSIVGGYGSPHGDLPIYVKTVFEKGAAAENGQLKRGDQIVAVDGEQLEGYTHEKAVAILKNAKGTVTLTVLS